MKNPAASASKDNMRHGLISLLTVVVVISIATAAVLTVATSHAMAALSERQATMTTEGYAAEQSAQEMLSYVDEELVASRQAKESRRAMLSRIEGRMNSLLVDACKPGVSATYVLDGNLLMCTFVTEGGRSLEASITIRDDATYAISAWRLTAVVQDNTSSDTLWTGSATKE